MNFTGSQKLALEVYPYNVIVSAGAGSGKTAVLTERIKRIIESGVLPTSLLVLTFTNAAAQEMKDRVRSACQKEPKLSKMLPLIEQSYITTFDSYSLALCKKYFYALNIDPSISVADSNVMSLKKKEVLEEILERYYQTQNEALYHYLDSFSGKNDSSLVEDLLSMSYSLDLLPNTRDYLETYITNYFSKKSIHHVISCFDQLTKNEAFLLQKDIEMLLSFDSSEKLQESLIQKEKMFKEAKDYQSLRQAVLASFDFPKASKTQGDDEEALAFRDQFKIKAKKVLEKYFNREDLLSIESEINSTKESATLFVEILKEFYIKMEEFKRKNNTFEFIDISKMAIELVTSHRDIREEIKKGFYQICIDEYQDTSDLQDAFIKQIENHNLFMVGDIKQSIYRFRNANPNIFKEKYNSYQKLYSEEDLKDFDMVNQNTLKSSPVGLRIDMIKNYRSREEVLKDINLIFSPLMTEDYGDADYQKSHQMVCGNLDYHLKYQFESNYHMKFMKYPYDSKEKNEFKPIEIEPFIVAKDILSRVGKQMVFDKEVGVRKAQFKDFCILVSTGAYFDSIIKILKYHQIPVALNSDEEINTSNITYIVCSMITLIGKSYESFHGLDLSKDNEYRHALASILRSFLFEMKDTEVYRILKTNDFTNEASQKAFELAKLIDKISNTDLYLKSLSEFHFFEKLVVYGEIEKSMAETEYFSTVITLLSDLGYHFKEIPSFLKDVLSGGNKIKYSSKKTGVEGVKLMNIHKSKGLEFPICYFIDLDHGKNKTEYNSKVGFDKEFGMYFPYDDEGVTNTAIKDLHQIEGMNQDASEHVRLFYVALTRAREQMIFVMPDRQKSIKYQSKSSIDTFLDALEYVSYNESSLKTYDEIVKIESLSLTKDYLYSKKKASSFVNHKAPVYKSPIKDIEEIKQETIARGVTKILTVDEKKVMKLGTRFHEVLQYYDFKNAIFLSNDKEAQKMVSNILSNPIFSKAASAKALHEHEFSCIMNGVLYHGIIDLLLIYEDHIDIIDYKLSNLNHIEYERQLEIYKQYVKTKSSLEVHTYLVSILKNEVKEIFC